MSKKRTKIELMKFYGYVCHSNMLRKDFNKLLKKVEHVEKRMGFDIYRNNGFVTDDEMLGLKQRIKELEAVVDYSHIS